MIPVGYNMARYLRVRACLTGFSLFETEGLPDRVSLAAGFCRVFTGEGLVGVCPRRACPTGFSRMPVLYRVYRTRVFYKGYLYEGSYYGVFPCPGYVGFPVTLAM